MIKLGYTATLKHEILSDGSEVFGVQLTGDEIIVMRCIDEQSAINLLKVYEHGVIDAAVI